MDLEFYFRGLSIFSNMKNQINKHSPNSESNIKDFE